MITVKLKKTDTSYELFVKGHAEYDIPGKDIVCAAVSILVYTLLESIDENVLAKPIVSILNPGNTYVRVDLGREGNGQAETAFFVVCNGFSILAKNFPKNVEFFEGRLLDTKK